MKILQILDSLPKEIEFNINKQKNYSTHVGIFSSLSIYAFVILVLVFYLNKIFSRQLDSTLVKSQLVLNSPSFNYTNFVPFIFRFEDDNGNTYENSSLFSIRAYYYQLFKDNDTKLFNGLTYLLNLTYCNISKFHTSYQKYLTLHNLNQAKCIDFDSNPQLNNTIKISGSSSESTFNYIQIVGSLCDTNYNYNCIRNYSFIQDYLIYVPVYFSFFTFEENFAQQNYSFPSEISIKNYYSIFNLGIYKSINDYLIKTEISSDIGLITSSMNITNIYGNEVSMDDIYVYDKSAKLNIDAIYMYVKSSNKVINVTRIYLKLQYVLTIVSAIFNSLITIFKLILDPFISKIYNEDIIAKVMNTINFTEKSYPKEILRNTIFKNPKKIRKAKPDITLYCNNKQIEINKNKDEDIINQNLIKNLNRDYNKKIDLKTEEYPKDNESKIKISTNPFYDNKLSEIKIIEKDINPCALKARVNNQPTCHTSNLIFDQINHNIPILKLFEISPYEYFLYYVSCKSKKFKKIDFLNKAMDIIIENLDIIHILNLTQQVETLKFALLDNKELRLLNLIYKQSFNKKIGNDLLSIIPFDNKNLELDKAFDLKYKSPLTKKLIQFAK